MLLCSERRCRKIVALAEVVHLIPRRCWLAHDEIDVVPDYAIKPLTFAIVGKKCPQNSGISKHLPNLILCLQFPTGTVFRWRSAWFVSFSLIQKSSLLTVCWVKVWSLPLRCDWAERVGGQLSCAKDVNFCCSRR